MSIDKLYDARPHAPCIIYNARWTGIIVAIPNNNNSSSNKPNNRGKEKRQRTFFVKLWIQLHMQTHNRLPNTFYVHFIYQRYIYLLESLAIMWCNAIFFSFSLVPNSLPNIQHSNIGNSFRFYLVAVCMVYGMAHHTASVYRLLLFWVRFRVLFFSFFWMHK